MTDDLRLNNPVGHREAELAQFHGEIITSLWTSNTLGSAWWSV